MKILTATLLILGFTFLSHAEEVQGYDVDKLADAIFLSEGGYSATYLYGIRSIPYKTEDEVRRICKNTIKNHAKRHANHKCGDDYLTCLGNRYCPTSGNLSKSEQLLNRNWLKSVRYFYGRNK
uniref:Uncharacterized protein n=1 Tax=viral metagenome TaxID=1070528 RepID=A0A6M3KQM7_9ZZZZ